MSGLVFAVTFSAVAVSAAQDLFEILAPLRSRLELLDVDIAQYSDFGDAAAEIIPIQFIRGYTTTGTGGSAATPAKFSPWSRASGVTAAVNNTTIAANGSPVILYSSAFNIADGFTYPKHKPDRAGQENERIFIEKAERFVVRVTAPADALTMSGTLTFKEIGMTAP